MQDKEAQAAAVARVANAIARREYANQQRAVRELMLTDWGRDFLWWLLRIGRVGLQPFSTDPYQSAFNCGEFNVGQQVLDRITQQPAGYLRMLEDQLNADRERTSAGEQDTADGGPNTASGGDDTGDAPNRYSDE